jgi:MFS family permease
MRNLSAAILVFTGGFIIMVLEIIGARFLAKDFGSAFYVWISQIGVILIALALGYYFGGLLADYFKRVSFLAWLLIPVGVYTMFIPGFDLGKTGTAFHVPGFAPKLIETIVFRHPNEEIPLIWQKLDPAMGSAVFFLLPCFVLAMLSPYMIRVSSTRLMHVGRISGLVYAFSTVGSIAGVFVSGYYFIDKFKISHIIAGTGFLTVLLGIFAIFISRYYINDDSRIIEKASEK